MQHLRVGAAVGDMASTNAPLVFPRDKATAITNTLLGTAILPDALRPYAPSIAAVLCGAVTAGLYGYFKCREKEKAKIRRAVFTVIKMVERREDYEKKYKYPEQIYAAMQLEMRDLVGENLSQKQMVKTLKELKRKADENGLLEPARKLTTKKEGTGDHTIESTMATPPTQTASSALDASAVPAITPNRATAAAVEHLRAAATNATPEQSRGAKYLLAAAAIAEASLTASRPAPKLDDGHKEHNGYEDPADIDTGSPTPRLELAVHLNEPESPVVAPAPRSTVANRTARAPYRVSKSSSTRTTSRTILQRTGPTPITAITTRPHRAQSTTAKPSVEPVYRNGVATFSRALEAILEEEIVGTAPGDDVETTQTPQAGSGNTSAKERSFQARAVQRTERTASRAAARPKRTALTAARNEILRRQLEEAEEARRAALQNQEKVKARLAAKQKQKEEAEEARLTALRAQEKVNADLATAIRERQIANERENAAVRERLNFLATGGLFSPPPGFSSLDRADDEVQPGKEDVSELNEEVELMEGSDEVDMLDVEEDEEEEEENMSDEQGMVSELKEEDGPEATIVDPEVEIEKSDEQTPGKSSTTLVGFPIPYSLVEKENPRITQTRQSLSSFDTPLSEAITPMPSMRYPFQFEADLSPIETAYTKRKEQGAAAAIEKFGLSGAIASSGRKYKLKFAAMEIALKEALSFFPVTPSKTTCSSRIEF
ncbi:hypothetical protein P154DRAFT_532572 [Amniculicola lignicola CBS 123094]|uniref:Uncharacterized protein n=1 Tax=Amniculicola lignicola CBS 123094 TaxID=1392246 RepID=A0A6A5WMK1_9PLEO|nr:hypothetical protein P154DRAFT_532572 [Amniculicola lignicola CBS 123094]